MIVYYCEQGNPYCCYPHCVCNTVRGKSYDINKNLFSNLLDEFDAENLKDNFVLTKTGGEITELKDGFYQPKKRVEIKLKNPKECEYFKEVGCIKDICTCYTLLDINLNE